MTATEPTPNKTQRAALTRGAPLSNFIESRGQGETSNHEPIKAATAKCQASNCNKNKAGQVSKAPKKLIHKMAWAGVGKPRKKRLEPSSKLKRAKRQAEARGIAAKASNHQPSAWDGQGAMGQ